MRYNYTKALAILRDYAIELGFKEVIFDHHETSQVAWNIRTLNTPTKIKIEGKHPVEIKVYLLLHELGHNELRKDWDRFGKLLPVAQQAETYYDNKYRRRQAYFVSNLEEEFMAWDEGLKLAERFGIKINRIKWDEYRSKCLMSYIRFYSTLKK